MTRNSALFTTTLLLSALLLFRAADAFWNSFRANLWHVADGVVTDSGKGWSEHQRANYKPVLSYEAHVRYTYRVAGREYTGSQIRFSPWGKNENFNPFVSSILRRYPAGAHVQAHYDPVNPSNSVLEPEVPFSDWVFLFAGILLAFRCVGYMRTVQAEKRAGP